MGRRKRSKRRKRREEEVEGGRRRRDGSSGRRPCTRALRGPRAAWRGGVGESAPRLLAQ